MNPSRGTEDSDLRTLSIDLSGIRIFLYVSIHRVPLFALYEDPVPGIFNPSSW